MGWGPPGIVILIALVGFLVVGLLHVYGAIVLLRSRYPDSNGEGQPRRLIARVFFVAIAIALLLDIFAVFHQSARAASHVSMSQSERDSLPRAR